MRKAVLYIALSLDGFIADSAGGVGWLHGHDPGLEEGSYGEFAATVDTVIMGRRTYDQVRGELSPGAWPYEGMDCYVLTHRPADGAPEGVAFTDEAPDKLLRRLRALPGRDIWICGGAETAMQLLRAGEIDVLRLSLIPTLLGGGHRLFGPPGREQRLRFLGCRAINGIAELTYVREGAGNDV